MLPDSRNTLYMGINFVISPSPRIKTSTNLKFQKSLVDRGIEFSNVAFQENDIAIERQAPTPLIVRVLSTQSPAIGQLVIVAPQTGSGLELFVKESEATVEAFHATWLTKRQVLASDVTFRDFYETSAQHAFQELWEGFLGQSGDALSPLGWSIQGGGLRFVIPPNPNDSEPIEIQLRIESFLQDTKKIWIESIFKWVQPMSPGEPLDPRSRLSQVDSYIENNVVPFITGGLK